MDAFCVRKENVEESSSKKKDEYRLSRDSLKKTSRSLADLKTESFQKAKHLYDLAKQSSNICGHVQQLCFSDSFTPTNLKLLRVDQKIADELLQSDGELVVRGNLSDFVVVCTRDKTYQVKEVEASNSYLLMENLQMERAEPANFEEFTSVEIKSITNKYLELTELTSTFSLRLREILLKHVLEVGEIDDNRIVAEEAEEVLNWDRLLNEIQLSEMQLRVELEKYPVIECLGRLHLLSEKSQQLILDEVVEMCDDFFTPEVTIYKLSSKALKQKLSFPEMLRDGLIEWFLKSFCDKIDESYYSLKCEKVCRARAREILHGDKEKEFQIETFKRLMQRTLPSGFEPSIDCLSGVAFIGHSIVIGETVKSLDANDLPMDVQKRLEKLFSMQPQWRKEDIEPYVIDFCNNSLKVEEFLLKHCRMLNKDSTKLFILKQL